MNVHPRLTLSCQGAMMTFGYSFNIWVPLLAFPTAGYYGAPRWRNGWPVAFAFWTLLFGAFITAVVLQKRVYVSIR